MATSSTRKRQEEKLSNCNHGLDARVCAYCQHGLSGAYLTESEVLDADDEDAPHPKPARSWGGEKNVSVLGRDGKPVLIPSTMQYVWTVTEDENDKVSDLLRFIWFYIPKTAEKRGESAPSFIVREDLAQDAMLRFMEWCVEEQVDDPLNHKKKAAFFAGRVYVDWRYSSRQATHLGLDDVTGLMMGPVERWAERGDYLPLLGVLEAARAATNPTPEQVRLVEAWRIFDPEFEGRLARDTRENPLTPQERKHLQRTRASILGTKEDPSVKTGKQAATAEATLSTMFAAMEAA